MTQRDEQDYKDFIEVMRQQVELRDKQIANLYVWLYLFGITIAGLSMIIIF